MSDKPYNIYTEANAASPLVTLADGERIMSVTVEPDGTNVVQIVVAMANLNHSDPISAKGNISTNWDGALKGPGTIRFNNLGLGHYVVTTETQ